MTTLYDTHPRKKRMSGHLLKPDIRSPTPILSPYDLISVHSFPQIFSP